MELKDAVEYTGRCPNDFDELIEFLIRERKNGHNIYIVLGGHTLYSANVKMDDAYMEFFGYKRKEFYEQLKECGREKAAREQGNFDIEK